ncbi:hypothetical protein [Paraburkholderia youngii]|uniref:hypothetical protein n=1 Tax=Paraburkholderia youngii TaxID=2782701 RepID=UPI003D221D25
MKRNSLRLFLPAVVKKAKRSLFGPPALVMSRPIRFIAGNGESVLKVRTAGGVTGFVAATVPVEAFPDWIRRLDQHAQDNRNEIRRILDKDDAASLRRA